MNKDRIAKEIARQWKCHLAFTPNKARTKKWIMESCERLCNKKTAKVEIERVVGVTFLRECPIPEDFTAFDPLDFV